MWNKWRALLLSLRIRLPVLTEIIIILRTVTSETKATVVNLCLWTQIQNGLYKDKFDTNVLYEYAKQCVFVGVLGWHVRIYSRYSVFASAS